MNESSPDIFDIYWLTFTKVTLFTDENTQGRKEIWEDLPFIYCSYQEYLPDTPNSILTATCGPAKKEQTWSVFIMQACTEAMELIVSMPHGHCLGALEMPQ